MKKLQIKELRKKTDEQLNVMMKTLKVAFSASFGKLNKDDAKFDMRSIKRNIARINTIFSERRWKKSEGGL